METNENNTVGSNGLTPNQVQAEIDTWTAKKVQIDQEKLILEFDKENFVPTIERKLRMNGRSLVLINGNLATLEVQLKEAREPKAEKEPLTTETTQSVGVEEAEATPETEAVEETVVAD